MKSLSILQAAPIRAARVERIQQLMTQSLATARALWLEAPAGGGKTTQAHEFCNSRRDTRWVSIRGGDACMAQFIDSLRGARAPQDEAGRQGPAPRQALRSMLNALPKECLLVLDDADEAGADGLGEVVDLIVGCLGEKRQLLVLSRSRPPARLTRMQLEGQLCVLTWRDLRLTPAEMGDAARAHGCGQESIDHWTPMLDGWTGGLAVLSSNPDNFCYAERGMRMISRYLLGQTLERMDRVTCRLLGKLSMLPEVGEREAIVLAAGEPYAWLNLDWIAGRCLFVEEVQAHPLRFRFHPAFRAMLQAERHTLLDAGELAQLQVTAAPMLEAAGCEIEAAAILLNLADEQALADLLERRLPFAKPGEDASRWAAFARGLSPAVAESRPWLAYWQGRHGMWSSPAEAAAALAGAAASFTARGDHVAATQALCAVVEARYIDGAPEAELESLAMSLLGQLGAAAVADVPAGVRLKANACAALALSASQPRGETIVKVVAATIALLDGTQDCIERLAAACKLLPCTPWMPDGAAQALVMEGDALVHAGDVPADAALAWCCASAHWHSEYSGDLHAAEVLVEAAAPLAKSLCAVVAERWLGATCTVLQLGRGATLQALLASRTTGAGASSKALAALAGGDLAAGLELADTACRSRAGLVRGAERSRFQAQVAALCAASGAQAQSEVWAARAAASACGVDADIAEDRQMLIAVWNHGSARRELADPVAAILKRHHDRGLRALFVVAPTLAARIAAFALDEGAAPQIIEAMIRRQGLLVPDRSCSQWPWPVRVRALGALSIEVDGQLQASTGKAQQRLLDLLRILAGAGSAGRTQQALETALWPDAESPKSAMAVAIHRLRKMLGRDDAVLVHAGNVMLNAEVVWTDIEAFKDLCTATEGLSAKAGSGQAERLAARLAGVYRGTFYEGDGDPWLVAVRSRLCASFVTCATTLGTVLESHGRWEAAGALYRRVLEAQPLCETAYRGLMRGAHAQGDFGAAFSFYRFCRDTLSVILNCEPSPETRRLAASLGLGGIAAVSPSALVPLRAASNPVPVARAA